MKALVLTGKKQLEIEDIKEPEIKPDEVLIHTAYAGICGTDKALYAGLPGSASAVPPIVLGHENSGVVTKVGSEVTNVKPGDRVTVDLILCSDYHIALNIGEVPIPTNEGVSIPYRLRRCRCR